MDLLDYLGIGRKDYGAYPSFQTSRGFEPERLLEGSVRVPGNDYQGHLHRSPPSGSPGTDIDVTYPTEQLTSCEKPVVRAPASGEVVFAGGRYGTVIIRDENDNYHKVLHMELRGPINYVKVGDHVEMGNPIGVLGGVHPGREIRDHVHYSVYDGSGTYLDPETLVYDVETGAAQESFLEESAWDSGDNWDDGGTDLDNESPIYYDNINPIPDNLA